MSNYLKELFKEKSLFHDILTLSDRFVSFLTVSSIFIAITGLLLPFFSFMLYGINPDFGLLLASFFLTFTVYNLNKLTDAKEDAINLPDRADFIQKNRQIIIFAVIVSFFAALFLSFLQKPSATFVILFPFVTGFVYSIKISNFRLKDIMGIKSMVVALAWAVIGTFLPLAVQSSDAVKIFMVFYFFLFKIVY